MMEFANNFSAFFVVFPFNTIRLSRATVVEDLVFIDGSLAGKFMLPDQKNAVCGNINKTMKRSFIASYLGININRIDKMMSQYKKGKPFHDDNVGIHKLDQQAYNSLPDLVKKKAKEQNNPVKRSQLFEIIQDAYYIEVLLFLEMVIF